MPDLLASILDFLPPILFAALGGVLAERAGVVNLGLEGMMRAGAFFGFLAAFRTGSPWEGALAGMAAGMAFALVLAFLAIHCRADQVVTGIALNLIALGLMSYLMKALLDREGSTDSLPDGAMFGRAWLGRRLPVWIALAAPFVLHFLLYRTVWGLRTRAVGEHPRAVESAGVSVARLRYIAVLGSGALAGLGGACLPLGLEGRFTEHTPAGQGFIALAAVIFGKWRPLGAFAAAAFFVTAQALQLTLQGSSVAWAQGIPKGFFHAFPYVVTLLALAGFAGKASLLVGRATPPAADGVPYVRGDGRSPLAGR